MELKLTIELVPQNAWYVNLRSLLTKDQWDQIRKEQYKQAKYVCEICGDSGKNHGYPYPVECHEKWQYDDTNHVQTLIGLIALCPFCHKTKHSGLAQKNNEMNIVVRQLVKVNSMTYREAEIYIHSCFMKWEERSEFSWMTNIEWIKNYFDKPVIEQEKTCNDCAKQSHMDESCFVCINTNLQYFQPMKTPIEALSEATGLPIAELEYRNEVTCLRPSEALEAMQAYHNQFKVGEEVAEKIAWEAWEAMHKYHEQFNK